MRFIVSTDHHIDYTNPISRTDSYFDQSLADLEFILNYAKSVEADAILMAGDLFEKPVQPGTVMVELIKMIRRYDVPIYTTIGQHDVKGHNPDEYPTKSIGILEAAGLLTVLRSGNAVRFDNCVIRGYAFNEPETTDFLEGRDEIPEGDDDLHIALVHATVGPDDCMGWAGISKQNIKSAALSIFGDIHCGFEPHTFKNGNIAVGPGSVGRRSIADKGRPPQFLDIEVDAEGDFKFTYIKVPQLPDESIFVEREEVVGESDLAAEFRAEWEKAQEVQDESPIQRVRRVGVLFQHTDEEVGLVLSHLPDEEDAWPKLSEVRSEQYVKLNER